MYLFFSSCDHENWAKKSILHPSDQFQYFGFKFSPVTSPQSLTYKEVLF